jgi:hypothetical protein
MLPIPFLKYIPKIFRNDSKAVTLATRIDTHLKQWKKDILEFQRLFRPDQTESKYLDDLGQYLYADILEDVNTGCALPQR